MRCLSCGSGGCSLRDNSGMAREHVARFGMDIPRLELWTCGDCGRGWAYVDGVLFASGMSWKGLEEAEVPAGALAVFGEVFKEVER